MTSSYSESFITFPETLLARWERFFVVGSLDLTWWPDLTWPWAEIFTKVAEKMGGKVGENLAALRAAVFSLSSKNLRGAFKRPPPPPSRARVNGTRRAEAGTGVTHARWFPTTQVWLLLYPVATFSIRSAIGWSRGVRGHAPPPKA